MYGKIFECGIDDDGTVLLYHVCDVMFDTEHQCTMAIFVLSTVTKPTPALSFSMSAEETLDWIKNYAEQYK